MIRYKILQTFIYSGRKDKINQRIQILNWLENNTGENAEVRIIADYHLAYLFDYLGTPKIAMLYAKKALPYCKKENFLYPETLTLLATIYYQLDKFDQASYYYSISYNESQNASPIIRSSHLNNLGLCENRKGNLEKSCIYLKKGLKTVSADKSYKGKIMYYIISGNLGSNYYEMREYNKAKPLLENEINYFLTKNENENEIFTPLEQILDIYYREKNANKQEEVIQNLLHSTYMNEPKNVYPNYTALIYKHYSRVNNNQKKDFFSNRLISKITYFDYENSKIQQQSTDILFEEKVKYLNQEIDNQKLLFNETQQKERLYLLLFILVFLFSGISMYLMRKLHLNKQKLTSQDILIKEEKIKAMALNMSIKSTTEKAFMNKLSEIKRKKSIDTTTVLRELQLVVNNILSIDKKLLNESYNLTDYELQFKTILKQKHPNLNDYEIQLCSYFRLRLSSKQIASVFDTSDGAIRVHKNKIKRKLQLETESSVEEYLTTLKLTH